MWMHIDGTENDVDNDQYLALDESKVYIANKSIWLDDK